MINVEPRLRLFLRVALHIHTEYDFCVIMHSWACEHTQNQEVFFKLSLTAKQMLIFMTILQNAK